MWRDPRHTITIIYYLLFFLYYLQRYALPKFKIYLTLYPLHFGKKYGMVRML